MSSIKEPITIEKLGHRGDGLAYYFGKTIIAPHTNVGDKILPLEYDLQKDRVHVKNAKIISKKNKKRTDVCPHYGEIDSLGCGGCSLQHLNEETYKSWKQNRLIEALSHNGLRDPEIKTAHFLDNHSRRRVVWHCRKEQDNSISLGYFKPHSHELVDIKQTCPILRPELISHAEQVRALLSVALNKGEECLFHLSYINGRLDGVIERKRSLKSSERTPLIEKAETFIHRLSFSEDGIETSPIHTPYPIEIDFSGIMVSVPPLSFLQATDEAEAIMQKFVTNHLKGSKRVVDLFCGLGTFTIPALKESKVKSLTAVDSNGPATQSLHKATKEIAIEVQERDLFRQPLVSKELNPFDTIIIDPPRVGAEEQFDHIARSETPKVISISCDPDSFARDAAILTSKGYTMHDLTLIDQFIWSHHFEVAACFKKKRRR